MRRRLPILLFSLFCLLLPAAVQGQPQLRNTTSFDTGDSLYYWSARIGARIYSPDNHDDTTNGYHVMSSCTWAEDLIGDSVIMNTVIGSNDSLNTFTDTCNNYGIDAMGRRFAIYDSSTAGIDKFTFDSVGGIGMQRIPNGYQTSIRLGCMVNCRSGIELDSLGVIEDSAQIHSNGSQSLFYTMRVTPENCLLIINYAIVARRYDHSTYEAGEFLVRVVQRDSTGQWSNFPINDSLWYKVSAPRYTTDLGPNSVWRVGAQGGDWPCAYVYKPWNKCAVNLSRFIGQDVRLEFYSSNCAYGVDPLYAYIAGDYMTPSLTSSGCPVGVTPAIDTLCAPDGMISYQWFACNEGGQSDLFDQEHLESLSFRRLTAASAYSCYCPSVTDFVLPTMDTVEEQTFMCIMTSALNPAKPFTSKLFVNVRNHKPVADYRTVDSCNLTSCFISTATPPRGDSIDHSRTFWVIYDDLYAEVALDTLYGDSVCYRFPELKTYMLEQHVFVTAPPGETPCGTIRRTLHSPKGPSEVSLRLSNHDICYGNPLTANIVFGDDARERWTSDRLSLKWTINDTLPENLPYSYILTGDTVMELPSPPEGVYAFELTAVNNLRCASVSRDTAYVYNNPRIIAIPSTGIICRGDTLVLQAYRDDMRLDSAYFEWEANPPDPTLDPQQGHQTLYLTPLENTRYVLHASPLSLCQRADVGIDIKVFPYPEPQFTYSPQAVDFDNPVVVLQDLTLGVWNTYWTFSDGQNETGRHTAHHYEHFLANGVTFTMTTCNEAGCCTDTTVALPLAAQSVWISNVFTPGQESNSHFSIITNLQLLDFEIYIYNRLGLLVYSSRDPEFRWDGTDRSGHPVPQGAYVYTLSYRLATSDAYRYSAHGTVTLLR